MSRHASNEGYLVKRHGILVLTEHWAIAISGLALVLTGLFELPIARRYFITEIPGLRWSGDYIFSLYLHYVASVVFVCTSLFHVVYHGLMGHRAILPRKGDIKESWEVIKSLFGKGEEPPFHKYLPEQRLAYVGIAVIIAGLIVSGLIKTWKNLFAPDMDLSLVLWATWSHNLFFVLFVLAFLAHMAAILIRPNRPMIRAIFTGKVRRDYAEHRHPLWIAELLAKQTHAAGAAEEESGKTIQEETDVEAAPEGLHPEDRKQPEDLDKDG